jgi:TATA-box binding protein (TBP) (component of TFIID and TFIIIB)
MFENGCYLLKNKYFQTKSKLKMFVFYNSPKNLFSQMVTMKLRQPYTTASIWSSGKITCTGANSEDQVHFQSGY